ncbi:SGNH/GDSL hydrolase family protein [Marinilabilia rubra]|uniref:SGNH hydrolase-type esterase domain-containing protein n=1 Tax=Marinilabilia rubra TaxID=2162893 RepID=A0A2U2BDB3_9BACT|nr:hypothetical protein [Marinilabilia rubra]PWE01051.1 hypothetical protein DDZ16_00755 [Marinilabilia rubra]
MIRPIKIFLYFILTALLIAFLDKALNDAGISLIPDIATINGEQEQDSSEVSLHISPEEKLPPQDSLQKESPDSLKNDSFPEIKTPLFVNDSVLTAPPGFQKKFRSFCNKAANAKMNQTVVRVLHLGDSQIEADRITGVLRNHFQGLYGGSGPGYVMPYDPLKINATVQLSNKGQWHLSYSYRKGNYPDTINFGFSGKAAWYSGGSAGFSVNPIPWKAHRLRQHPNVGLLASSLLDTVGVRAFYADSLEITTSLYPSDSLQIIKINSEGSDNIQFSFESDRSPVIHGVTLDAYSGIAVDNLAMRGRPWPGFRLANNDMLKQMARKLNVGLLIIQFGTNVLPTETTNYNFYQIHFLKELQLIQKLLPDVPALVIGVQSAAKVAAGEVEPMKHARLISEAQKSATLACDMGFFDLHKAMGGTNGAVEWAKQEPSLMLSDYMHFSGKGARIVGDRIWTSLDSLRVRIPSVE